MFNSAFYDIIKNYNQTINTINCTLREIEKDITHYIEDDPAVILYSYDPLANENYHYFKFEYPNIVFSLAPFQIVISYKEIMEKIDGRIINRSNIELIIEELILNCISPQ